MLNSKLAKPMLVALAACAASVAFNGVVFADDAQTQALKDQMRIMQQQMQDLQRKIDALSQQQAASAQAPAPSYQAGPEREKVAKQAPPEPAFEKFAKGFFGTLDVSIDDATKGMGGLVAYPYTENVPGNPAAGYSISGGPKGGPVGRVGWQPDLSTNKSLLGYRGSHKIPETDVDFIYQLETQPQITATPGISGSYTSSSNVTKAGIGYGDSFVGLSNAAWGKIKFGTSYTPYKRSTDRMNPFSGMLGDYGVIMGNTGGDNRTEFGSRIDHSVWYESPNFGNMVSFDLMFSPGQNRTPQNDAPDAGDPDCAGGNTPGSGNLPLACADGAFNNVWSFDVKFETGPIYVTAAYEIHQEVNRSSDGIGANSPIYAALYNQGNGVSPLLDWADYNAFATEFPEAAPAGTPGYNFDVANETAFKVGVQYTFDFGLVLSGIYEDMHRNVPSFLEFQNERQRNGHWFAATQKFSPKDDVSIGWAHAGITKGDPGGQHNYNPTSLADYANMYTIAWKHHFDKNLYWYLDAADTVNHGNAHFDLGAGGRAVTTDCHDGTTFAFVDYSSAGPTTWGGCHPLGFSTGLHYTF